MPDHRRKVVLDALKAQIVAAATDAGSNVFRSRTLAFKGNELPAVNIRFRFERLLRQDAAVYIDREMVVSLYLKAKDTPADPEHPGIEDDLIALSLQVENALQADTKLGGACSDLEIDYAGEPQYEGRDQDYGDWELRIMIRYRTNRLDAGAAVAQP